MRNHIIIAAALALAAPSMALAQPAPHHTVGQVLDIEGEVYLPAGGAPMIGVNKSNVFQVQNAPFRSILAQCIGRRVKARVRMVQPGPFGGRVDVQRLEATNAGTARIVVRAAAAGSAPVFARLAPGRSFSVTGVAGAHARYYVVRLADGRRGHILRSSTIAIGSAPAAAGGIARLDRFEFTSYIEWGGDHVQVHLKVERQADGSFKADIDGEDMPTPRTGVALSSSAVLDLLAALDRFKSFPDDSFAGDGNHWHYAVRAEGADANGAAATFRRSFYEPGDENAMRQVSELANTVEAIVRSLSAGPVGGLVGTIPGQ